jgi:hypothetical protein
MKTKARDIVLGWPKGRSTTVTNSNDFYLLYDIWPYTNNSDGMQEQYKLDRLYHQMQQAMVNEWFARYRLGDVVFKKDLLQYIQTGENAAFNTMIKRYRVRTEDCIYCHWMNIKMMTFDVPYCSGCIHRGK